MKIIIRKAELKDADGIGYVHTKSWQESYQGIVDDDYLAQRDVKEAQKKWTETLKKKSKDVFRYVALEGDKVVGFAVAGTQRSEKIPADGEVYAIYLLEEYQGHKTGLSMMANLFSDLSSAGFTKVSLWALSDNIKACQFYQKLGALKYSEEMVDIGAKKLPETIFVWDKIPALDV